MKKLFILLLFLSLGQISAQSTQSILQKMDINNISTYIWYNGECDISDTGYAGFEYPKGSGKTLIFESGLVWGGVQNGVIKVGGSNYRSGLKPGRILQNGSADDPNNQNLFKVNRDDNSNWNTWPAEWGAPYEDIDNDGFYNPDIDIPGFPGADQTIWLVTNDLDPVQTQHLHGSLPLGLEMQLTVWAYKDKPDYENMIFKKYKLVNRSNDTIKDMFVLLWNDFDIGNAVDDFAGCDTNLNLCFGYNAFATDAVYGSNLAAVGFDYFQGPIIDGKHTDIGIYNGVKIQGKKNLPAFSHYFYVCGDPIYRDPKLGLYQGTIEFYNYMQGFTADGNYFISPIGDTTKFTLAGDPVTGTGWIDGQIHPAGDRRNGFSSGPFDMKPMEEQEIVIAQIAAGGTEGIDNLEAVTLLKEYSQIAQNLYDNSFNLKDMKEITGQVQFAGSSDPVEGAKLTFVGYISVDSLQVNLPEHTYEVYTDANGNFSKLVENNIIYHMFLEYEYGSGLFYKEFYNDAYSVSDATPITVSDETTETLLMTIPVEGSNYITSFTGFVGDVDSLALADTKVKIQFIRQDADLNETINLETTTDVNGNFTLEVDQNDLPIIPVREVVVVAEKDGYVKQFYNGTDAITEAKSFYIGGNSNTFSVGFSLRSTSGGLGNTLSGVIKDESSNNPIKNAFVVAQNTGDKSLFYTYTNSSGQYSLNALSNGNYKLLFTADGYIYEFYNNKLIGEEADLINVAGNVENINAELVKIMNVDLNSLITGLTVNEQVPESGVFIYVKDNVGNPIYCTYSNGEGDFKIINLDKKEYEVITFTFDEKQSNSNIYFDPNQKTTLLKNIDVQYGVNELDEEFKNSPTEFYLSQNYPNPFNPSTKISFNLPEASIVKLSVYNILGEQVALLKNAQMNAGVHTVDFNASHLSSGIYFYRIETEKFSETKKMILLK
ncbi:MAG: carboxypeptidase regulatory-like domain-containing protein [Ignavibacteriales bacterium]|nr:carboxypeptidase regulatory-like domain-containing protein [Ignavibacteriales bacterium]